MISGTPQLQKVVKLFCQRAKVTSHDTHAGPPVCTTGRSREVGEIVNTGPRWLPCSSSDIPNQPVARPSAGGCSLWRNAMACFLTIVNQGTLAFEFVKCEKRSWTPVRLHFKTKQPISRRLEIHVETVTRRTQPPSPINRMRCYDNKGLVRKSHSNIRW